MCQFYCTAKTTDDCVASPAGRPYCNLGRLSEADVITASPVMLTCEHARHIMLFNSAGVITDLSTLSYPDGFGINKSTHRKCQQTPLFAKPHILYHWIVATSLCIHSKNLTKLSKIKVSLRPSPLAPRSSRLRPRSLTPRSSSWSACIAPAPTRMRRDAPGEAWKWPKSQQRKRPRPSLWHTAWYVPRSRQ